MSGLQIWERLAAFHSGAIDIDSDIHLHHTTGGHSGHNQYVDTQGMGSNKNFGQGQGGQYVDPYEVNQGGHKLYHDRKRRSEIESENAAENGTESTETIEVETTQQNCTCSNYAPPEWNSTEFENFEKTQQNINRGSRWSYKPKVSVITTVGILFVLTLIFLILVMLSREFCFCSSNYSCFLQGGSIRSDF